MEVPSNTSDEDDDSVPEEQLVTLTLLFFSLAKGVAFLCRAPVILFVFFSNVFDDVVDVIDVDVFAIIIIVVFVFLYAHVLICS